MTTAQGKEIERTGKYSDYRERPTDLMGKGVGKWGLVEVKTQGAKLSKGQERKREEVGNKRYKVVRVG